VSLQTGGGEVEGKAVAQHRPTTVAGQFKVGFWNEKGLRSKVCSKDFSDVLWNHEIFGIAESWAGLEVYEINGFISFSKGRTKVTKFGRNPGGLVVYIREGISKQVTEIATNMKEILWVGVSKKRNSKVEICIGFIYNAPQSSQWYNPNFTRELQEEMK
jgi:hypothetical protein